MSAPAARSRLRPRLVSRRALRNRVAALFPLPARERMKVRVLIQRAILRANQDSASVHHARSTGRARQRSAALTLGAGVTPWRANQDSASVQNSCAEVTHSSPGVVSCKYLQKFWLILVRAAKVLSDPVPPFRPGKGTRQVLPRLSGSGPVPPFPARKGGQGDRTAAFPGDFSAPLPHSFWGRG